MSIVDATSSLVLQETARRLENLLASIKAGPALEASGVSLDGFGNQVLASLSTTLDLVRKGVTLTRAMRSEPDEG